MGQRLPATKTTSSMILRAVPCAPGSGPAPFSPVLSALYPSLLFYFCTPFFIAFASDFSDNPGCHEEIRGESSQVPQKLNNYHLEGGKFEESSI